MDNNPKILFRMSDNPETVRKKRGGQPLFSWVTILKFYSQMVTIAKFYSGWVTILKVFSRWVTIPKFYSRWVTILKVYCRWVTIPKIYSRWVTIPKCFPGWVGGLLRKVLLSVYTISHHSLQEPDNQFTLYTNCHTKTCRGSPHSAALTACHAKKDSHKPLHDRVVTGPVSSFWGG